MTPPPSAYPASTPPILVFSGHNDRAVIALCRFFDAHKVPFVISASSVDDAIFETAWTSKVQHVRTSPKVDTGLFKEIIASSKQPRLTYCPTTEFINNFALANRDELVGIGISIPLPLKDIYDQLTNKSSSGRIIKSLIGITPPSNIEWPPNTSPCVLKPNANVSHDKVFYPILCTDQKKLEKSVTELDPKQWFAQEYIDGQSYYLCGYITKEKEHAHFWQENLMQQPEGKSIVLAKSALNPGIDAGLLLSKIASMGYHGPFMMEIIKEKKTDHLYFIEINPRFWGPLQLAVDQNPGILELFLKDIGIPVTPTSTRPESTQWYAWAAGALTPGCKIYPRLDEYSPAEISMLIEKHDLYNRADTLKLHGVH